jgi:hypothetical protein
MKQIFLAVAIFLFFNACSDGNRPEINGMWQLKTVEDENKNSQIIDTIFYSFQRQAIFSYTILKEEEGKPATYSILYGYINFPEENQLLIQLDKNYLWGKSLLPWDGEGTTFDIVQLNSRHLVLRQDGKTYNFIKY